MTNSKLPVIGKHRKIRPFYPGNEPVIIDVLGVEGSRVIIAHHSSISINTFWDNWEELPNQEPTTAESSTVDKTQEALKTPLLKPRILKEE